MYLTRKHLSRRTLLRGVGAAVALPFLDAMVPAGVALAQTAAAPKPRVGFFYLPHGVIQDRWVPPTEGPGFTLSPTLEPLAPLKSRLTVITGLANKPSESSAVHAITPGTWLSCVTPARSHAPRGGITVDQIAAQHIGQDTPLPSIEVATERNGGSAACDGTFGCSFGNTISFRTPNTPLPMEFDPSRLFQRLFGDGNSPEERAQISGIYRSVLDNMVEQAGDLRRSLGPGDRAMLDNYLTSVREIERRVALAEQNDVSQYDLPDLPPGLPDFDGRLRLMFDMIAVAYQADITRVASFMMAAEVSNQAYTHLNIPDAFHPLSHHNNDPQKMDMLARLQRYHVQVFADFAARLAEMPDGDGSVLDNSVLLFGGNMGDGARHDAVRLPTAILGGGCGAIRGDRHLACADRTPIANMHLTLLNRIGVPTEQFGDSTGELTDI